jgi:hypothetical protein
MQDPRDLVRAVVPLAPLAAALFLATSACSGTIDGAGTPGVDPAPGAQPSGPPSAGGGPLPEAARGQVDPKVTPPERKESSVCKGVDPGPGFIRRLTRIEYDNTVRDLLGDGRGLAKGFPPEERSLGFDNIARVHTVSPRLAEDYLRAAEALAEGAVAKLDAGPAAFLGCDPAKSGEDPCAKQFLASFAKRAYRRPAPAEELAILEEVYAAGKATEGFRAGIKLALAAALQSPRFLYRVELGAPPTGGAPGAVTRLDPWETASRLSYLLWNSMPDAALLQAAERNELVTREQIAAQVSRMLADDKAKEALRNFMHQWLELHELERVEKNATIFKSFTPAILEAMKRETDRMIDHAVWEANADLTALFTAPYTFLDRTLAGFYGMPMPPEVAMAAPGTLVRVASTDARPASGLLSQGLLMTRFANANQTSPVLRGEFVREQLLCTIPPPPPEGLVIELPPLDPNLTTRERFSRHATQEGCAGCHRLMDPIGLGFENYDGVGVWRSQEAGRPVDASGQIFGVPGEPTFVGVEELGQRLAESPVARDCVVLKAFHFGYGRGEVPGVDDCSLDVLRRRFEGSGFRLKDLLVALTETDAFLYKRVETTGQGGTP